MVLAVRQRKVREDDVAGAVNSDGYEGKSDTEDTFRNLSSFNFLMGKIRWHTFLEIKLLCHPT